MLSVNGSVAGSVTVAAGAALGGSGVIGGGIGGDGLIGPGNSPGILTVMGTLAPTASTSFAFELTQSAPVWSDATASGNDVLRLTNGSPFASALQAGNVVNVYLDVSSLAQGDSFLGGFFADDPLETAGLLGAGIGAATFRYYVMGNGLGAHVYNGAHYYAFDEYLTANPGLGLRDIVMSVVNVGSADFAGGTITTGQITRFEVVPEPGSLALAGVGLAVAALKAWRRRRTG